MKSMEKQEVSFIKGSLIKALIAFSAPFMLGVLVQNLYGAVDLFVVGHYATTADVSAVTIGSQLMTIITQLVIGLATGITVLVGQYFGANNKERLSRTLASAIVLFAGVALLLTGLYLGFHSQLAQLMQTPAEALVQTEQYLFCCALGIVFIVGYNVIASILTGLGNAKTPFLFICVACVINIVLDVVLVKLFGMGAMGAAIATTTAQAGSFFFSLLYLKRKGLGFPLVREALHIDRHQLRLIFTIGGPVAIQNMLVSISFLFITAIINQLGIAASAAVGIVEKLITFLFVPAIGMGTAVGTAAAQNIGAGQPERARRAMWVGIGLTLVPAVIIVLVCQFGAAGLASLLTGDPAVIALSADYLHSYIFDVLMVSFVFCMNGYFNSYGKSWFSLLHSLITTFLGRIPLAFLFSKIGAGSLFAIGWAAPASTFLSLIFCLAFLWYLHRREKREQRMTPRLHKQQNE